MDRWPHQIRGVQQVIQSIHSGIRRVLLTCPTGGGKTVIMSDLITWGVENGLPVSLYTNRKMLIEQTSAVLSRLSIDHGIRASGHESNHHRTVQVSSIQTEHVRCIRSSRWDLHPAGLVLVDEAHMQKSGMAQEILSRHAAQGASIVGLTATPIGLADMYDHLIVAGTNSELRQCGALLPCMHYGPDEPDLKHVRKVPLGEDLSEQQVRSIIMVPGVFARVITWFKKLNPEYKPTILFAPGVKESIYFAEEFSKAGITAAHIDGDDIWIDGSLTRSDRETRSSVLEASRSGKVKVICNRFVLREGVDAPWLAHGIFATVFGSLQSYLQSGGRLLRSHPSLRQVIIQDHGGGWWRHGSLNADRVWRLEYTERMISGMREDRFRQPADRKDPEPIRCPQCGMVIAKLRCPCGWELKGSKRSRPVVQADGSLREHEGDIYTPRRIDRRPNGPELWKKMVYRSKTTRGDRTFKAAAALFAYENAGQWPDPTWPMTPKHEEDWYRHVKDVPKERLN